MPTSRNQAESMITATASAPGPYLPSPPQTPRYDTETDVCSRPGLDDNTAGAMAAAQERSMYIDRPAQTDDPVHHIDPEKITLPLDVSESTSTPNSTADSPLLPIESEATGQDCTHNAAIEAAVETVASTRFDRLKHHSAKDSAFSASMPRSGSDFETDVRSALLTPSSPPPTTTASSSTSKPSQSENSATSNSIHSLSSEFTNVRLTPAFTSSFLRPGARYTGTQQSDRQIYHVDVEILHVSIPEETVSGYLNICGLTDSHPTLTTYFEGEIIGMRHTFQTRHRSWGATDKTDMQHWARFPAWRPLAKEARRPGFSFGVGWWNKENIFMRWKEHFLVPDHRVRSIQGASFEGFYYICFNQVEGRISGIYFHAKSENSGINDRYQQLELKHVPNKGCLGSIEFR